MSRINERLAFGGLVPAIVALDHVTKTWARNILDGGESVSILPFFDLTLSFNRGVAFGLLDSASVPVVLVLTTTICVLFAVWFWREPRTLTRLALALVLGGALGNVLDRSLHGSVTDFLDVHVADLHWPAFNLADSAITIGALLLVFGMLGGRTQGAS